MQVPAWLNERRNQVYVALALLLVAFVATLHLTRTADQRPRPAAPTEWTLPHQTRRGPGVSASKGSWVGGGRGMGAGGGQGGRRTG